MTALVVWTLVGLAVTGYLYGWWRFAVAYAARHVEECIRDFGSLAKRSTEVERWRREGLGLGFVLGCIWPLAVAGRVLMDRSIGSVPRSTYEAEQINRQQKARIAELERELGVGRSS